MAELVNLRQARKARSRAEKRATGNQNAARFGRTKSGKALEEARTEQAKRLLDGHRRERPSETDDQG